MEDDEDDDEDGHFGFDMPTTTSSAADHGGLRQGAKVGNLNFDAFAGGKSQLDVDGGVAKNPFGSDAKPDTHDVTPHE